MSSADLLAEFEGALRRRDASAVACLDTSTLARALHSSDSSIYRILPRAVAHPRDTAEAATLVSAAHEVGMPVTTRGAGTSCAGNAIGPGLVVDLSAHLDRVVEVDPDTATAVVEPGVVQAHLQRVARPHGLRLGPDPSTSSRCTVGGMIGNNACGPRALAYGRTGDSVVEADLLTADGSTVHLGPDRDRAAADPRIARLVALVDDHADLVRSEFATFSRQLSGYQLETLLPGHGGSPASFVAGTEGTLGIVTRARVRLVREPPHSVTVALGYPSMAEAADDVTALLPFEPVACEGFGRAIVDVVARAGGRVPDLPAGQGWMFVELRGEQQAEVRSRARAMVAASGSLEGRVVTDPAEAGALWRIRADGAGLAGIALDRPAWAGWEDSAVPPARLGSYLRDFEALLAEHGLHTLPYGHFGEGCLHCRVDVPLDAPDGPTRYRRFVTEAAELVVSHGGSLSGEHGDGRARSALLPLMYSSGALDLMARVKAVLDPDGILNPGVLVDPDPVEADIRVAQARVSPLRISHPDLAAQVHRCTGVGLCLADRSDQGGVMCPSYRATGQEKDSTRGRAVVLQEMVNGHLVTGWDSPEVAQALDLCLACKGCARDCPTGVDVARWRSTVLDEKYRHRLRPRSHLAMGWLPRWLDLATAVPGLPALANWAGSRPRLARVARWLAGVDHRRTLPTLRPPARRQVRPADRSPAPARPGPARGAGLAEGTEVAVWVDSFSDMLAGGDLDAVLHLLRDAGLRPRVITERVCCGLTWITTGQLEGARRRLRAGLDVLTPLVERGVPVVGLEPSCTAVWRSDAVDLLPDDPRAALVARHVHTLAEVLESARWRPAPRPGCRVVVQPHCHHSAVLGFGPDRRLLEATGATVEVVAGCCGYAGNFGVEKGHYDTSVAVAHLDLLPAIERAGGDVVVVADGFSCRSQTRDLAGVEAITLARFLAGGPAG